jgi:hypothetical protein
MCMHIPYTVPAILFRLLIYICHYSQIFTCLCMYICICIYKYVYIVFIYVYVNIYLYIHNNIYFEFSCIYICVFMNIFKSVHTCVHIYTLIEICSFIDIYASSELFLGGYQNGVKQSSVFSLFRFYLFNYYI